MRTLTIHPRAYHLLTNRPITHQVPGMPALLNNLRKTWHLEQDDQDKLHQYYLHKWEGSWLAQQLAQTNSGNIIHNNVVYSVQYYQGHPVEACAAKAVMLSFRQVKKEYYTVNYVLVRIVEK